MNNSCPSVNSSESAGRSAGTGLSLSLNQTEPGALVSPITKPRLGIVPLTQPWTRFCPAVPKVTLKAPAPIGATAASGEGSKSVGLAAPAVVQGVTPSKVTNVAPVSVQGRSARKTLGAYPADGGTRT